MSWVIRRWDPKDEISPLLKEKVMREHVNTHMCTFVF